MTNALIAEGGRQFGRMHDRGFHPLFALLCLILVGAAIGLVVWLVVRRRPAVSAVAPAAPVAASPTAAAEAILAERLARGEIAPDDYRTYLAALRGENPPA
jgi:putative membrane protein